MLDHIIASRPLLRYFRRAEVHNEALPDESGAFRDDTKFPESDHAPHVADLLRNPDSPPLDILLLRSVAPAPS